MAGLAAVLAKHPQVYVIADEIYEHITYSGKHESIAQFPEIHDNVIIVNGVSKAYAMTGWRMGYSAAPQWLASACDKVQGQMTSGANTVAQKASITALMTDPKEYHYMVEQFEKRRNIVFDLMKDIPGFKVLLPKAAFYFFPDISFYIGKTLNGTLIKDADDFSMFLLETAHVASVGGVSFGSPECIRFSYAASEEELREAMHRIHECLTTVSIQ